MARRAGGSVVVALCLVAAALGTSMAGADELHVSADWGGTLADVVAVGYTWHGTGLIWGWGDDVVCYRWTFTDTMTQVDGRITNVREAFEVSTPPINHQFNSKGHHQIWLSAWWEKNGPATAVTAKLDVAVVEVTIISGTTAAAGDGTPRTRTELGIGELVWCTAEADPHDVLAGFWWEVSGVGKEGPENEEPPSWGSCSSCRPSCCPVRAQSQRTSAWLGRPRSSA